MFFDIAYSLPRTSVFDPPLYAMVHNTTVMRGVEKREFIRETLLYHKKRKT